MNNEKVVISLAINFLYYRLLRYDRLNEPIHNVLGSLTWFAA